MTKMLGLLVILTGCVGMEADEELDVGETELEISGDQVAAMNQAAQGTGIRYTLNGTPQRLWSIMSPNPDLPRVGRHVFAGHVADVLHPPDPCSGDRCVGPSVRVGPATTAWTPPDPCVPPDPCRTSIDLAGGNLRVIGSGAVRASGGFELTFQVIDAAGEVVFDSEAY